jgi:hypothetical protein
MVIFYTNERPAALPAAVAPLSAVRVALAAARPSVPQVHQVEAQAELILATAPNGDPGDQWLHGQGCRCRQQAHGRPRSSTSR